MPSSHVPAEFPSECVAEFIAAIGRQDWRSAVPCALTVLSWLWQQMFSPPLGDGDTVDAELFSKVAELHQQLGGEELEVELNGVITSSVFRLLLVKTAKLVVKYIEDNGGISAIVKLIEGLIDG